MTVAADDVPPILHSSSDWDVQLVHLAPHHAPSRSATFFVLNPKFFPLAFHVHYPVTLFTRIYASRPRKHYTAA